MTKENKIKNTEQVIDVGATSEKLLMSSMYGQVQSTPKTVFVSGIYDQSAALRQMIEINRIMEDVLRLLNKDKSSSDHTDSLKPYIQDVDNSKIEDNHRKDTSYKAADEDKNKIQVFDTVFSSNNTIPKIIVVVKYMKIDTRNLMSFMSRNSSPRIDYVFEDVETHGLNFKDEDYRYVVNCIFGVDGMDASMGIVGSKGFDSIIMKVDVK